MIRFRANVIFIIVHIIVLLIGTATYFLCAKSEEKFRTEFVDCEAYDDFYLFYYDPRFDGRFDKLNIYSRNDYTILRLQFKLHNFY